MRDYKILHVTNKDFSIAILETILNRELPGTYRIYWHTKTNKWEINLRWDGTNYTDLYDYY